MTKARKDHVCTLCGDPIPVGTEYARQTIWPDWRVDHISTFRAHPQCDGLWQKIGDRYEWEPPDEGEWRQAMAEEAAAT